MKKFISIFFILVAVAMLWRFNSQAPVEKAPLPIQLKHADPVIKDTLVIAHTQESPLPVTPRIFQTIDPIIQPLVDRSRPVHQRVPIDITSKMPQADSTEDQRTLVAVLTDVSDDDTVRNEVANLLRRSNYSGLNDALIQVLENPNEKPRFRSFAIQHLGMGVPDAAIDPDGREKVLGRLHSALDDQEAGVRREALLALTRQNDPKSVDTAIRWLNTENAEADSVRDLAIRCVKELDRKETIPTIRKYLRNSNEVICIAAIVALSEWGDEESRAAFEDASRSKIVRIQRAGKAALQRLEQARLQTSNPLSQ